MAGAHENDPKNLARENLLEAIHKKCCTFNAIERNLDSGSDAALDALVIQLMEPLAESLDHIAPSNDPYLETLRRLVNLPPEARNGESYKITHDEATDKIILRFTGDDSPELLVHDGQNKGKPFGLDTFFPRINNLVDRKQRLIDKMLNSPGYKETGLLDPEFADEVHRLDRDTSQLAEEYGLDSQSGKSFDELIKLVDTQGTSMLELYLQTAATQLNAMWFIVPFGAAEGYDKVSDYREKIGKGHNAPRGGVSGVDRMVRPDRNPDRDLGAKSTSPTPLPTTPRPPNGG